MNRSLQQIAEAVAARLSGDGTVRVSGVASIASADSGDVVFVEERKHLSSALESQAAAVIAGEFALNEGGAKPLLISDHPKLTFARVARFLGDRDHAPQKASVHGTAVVHASARLGPGAALGEHVIVGESVEIGENTSLAAGCAIAAGVKIGKDCRIYPNVTIYGGTVLGERVIVHAGAV